MTKAHDGSSGRAAEIEQQAAEWVTRIDSRGTPEEWVKLDAWLAISPRHRAAFLRLSVAWRRADGLKQLAPLNGAVDMDLFDPAHSRVRMPSADDVLEGRLISIEAHRGPIAGSEADPLVHGTRAEAARALRVVASTPRPIVADSSWAAVRRYRASSGASPGDEAGPAQRDAAAGERARFLTTRRLAASVAIFAVAGLGGFGAWQAVSGNEVQTFTAQVGEFRRVTLSDGSTVGLNTASEVRVHYTDTARRVELVRGEALFEVAKNPQRPFDVRAASTTVRAVGTAFSVRLHEESDHRVDVVVSEGRVAINPPSKETYTAGSVATVRKGGVVSSMLLPLEEIEGRLAWTQGRLVVLDEALGTVVAEMNRYNDRKLRIVDPKIAGLSIGGTFQVTDPDRFAKQLRPLGIRARVDTRALGNDVILLDAAPQ